MLELELNERNVLLVITCFKISKKKKSTKNNLSNFLRLKLADKCNSVDLKRSHFHRPRSINYGPIPWPPENINPTDPCPGYNQCTILKWFQGTKRTESDVYTICHNRCATVTSRFDGRFYALLFLLPRMLDRLIAIIWVGIFLIGTIVLFNEREKYYAGSMDFKELVKMFFLRLFIGSTYLKTSKIL